MSTGVGDHPQVPFQMFNIDGLKSTDDLTNEIDCGEPVLIEENPNSATLEDVCLSSKPEFYTDNEGNFVILFNCDGGYIGDDCSISSDGTGIVTMTVDPNYKGQLGVICSFGPNGAQLPTVGHYFWFEIKVPAKKVNDRAQSVKWAYKRRSR